MRCWSPTWTIAVLRGQPAATGPTAENVRRALHQNQWGWGGFTTHDLHRCQLSARGVACSQLVELFVPQPTPKPGESHHQSAVSSVTTDEHVPRPNLIADGQRCSTGSAAADAHLPAASSPGRRAGLVDGPHRSGCAARISNASRCGCQFLKPPLAGVVQTGWAN